MSNKSQQKHTKKKYNLGMKCNEVICPICGEEMNTRAQLYEIVNCSKNHHNFVLKMKDLKN